MALRTVAIVGRPNVGKSTLFNRIVGQKRSVVHETPGVTRDRIVEQTDWAGHSFILMDTGGIIPFREGEPPPTDFDRLVTEIARDAVAASDVIIFLVDAVSGPTDWDTAIAEDLRRSGKPVVLGVNKAEKEASALAASEFYALGLGEPHPISALHGRGVGDFLDQVVADFPPLAPTPPCDVRVAILGRPNVGKSSLLNQLVGHEAALVTDVPGTTRDAIHTDMRWHGRTVRLIDTAGLRRKSRVVEAIEAFSAMRTMRALVEADVAILLVDADAGTTAQDVRIGGLIHDGGKGCVVVFNKWDLVEKDQATHRQVWDEFLRQAPFLTYAPWFTLSALTKQRLGRVMEVVWEVHEARQRRVETGEFNRFLGDIVKAQPPRTHAGGTGRIYYGTQTSVAPPTFVLSVNDPAVFARHYLRFLNNRLREQYGFQGTRIFIKLKKH